MKFYEVGCYLTVSVFTLFAFSASEADIHHWQTGATIPGTEGLNPGPGDNLSRWNTDGKNLRFADFTDGRLAGVLFRFSDLTNARFQAADLTNAQFFAARLDSANLTDAIVRNANFTGTTKDGFQDVQFYSTASYQQRDLRGVVLAEMISQVGS